MINLTIHNNEYIKEKNFDLNIEKILENWSIHHALREIISNALDEQFLTNTKNIQIYKDQGIWHIVDFGRGLSYLHLTQNENEEKKQNTKLIGRFGVGLKDALATLYRHGVNVQISSKFGIITLSEAQKEGFDDIVTLHAKINPPIDSKMIGTDFSFWGCDDSEVFKAKQLFLCFTDNNILDNTIYGQIIEKKSDVSNIYINGVKVAEESNFLFSYNITSLNRQIIKALNRERTNIGRSAYSERIKNILLSCSNTDVIDYMIDDLQEFSSGKHHDELTWTEVQLFASKLLSERATKVTFVTPEELKTSPSIVDDMNRNGYSPVIVSKKLLDKIEDLNENADEEEIITTTSQYLSKQKDEFQPIYVDIGELTDAELNIYNQTDNILSLIGGCPPNVWNIKLTEQIYNDEIYTETLGTWIASKHLILIKRKQLSSLKEYSETLLHECAHALSCADDMSREFEAELTSMLGQITNQFFKISTLTKNFNGNQSNEDFFNSLINQIADEIEDNCEHTMVIDNNLKIDKELYDSILQNYQLNEEELYTLNEELNDRSISIVEKFNQKSLFFKDITSDIENLIIESSKLYFDDIESILDGYDLDYIEQEQIYSFLFNKYDISYDNKYVDKLKAFTIIFKDQLKLISKENYEKIREESSLKYYEIIEDYIEENRIFILTEDFISLLDLIRITTNIFNRKISKDMLDDFIFEYNLNYDEVTFLNNWIVINKITILENSKFPFDQLSSTDYLEIYKEDENIFLIKIYQNLYKFIPGFNKNSIFQIKRLFDLYFKYFKDFSV